MPAPRSQGPTLDEIRAGVRTFDGKDLTALRALAARMPADEAGVSRLLSLLPSPDDSVELGVTWLVKNLLERTSGPLPARRSRRLVKRLLDCRLDWSRLHLLQSLSHTRLGTATRNELESALWQWLDETKHGFTRAWVYDGLVRCSERDTEQDIRLLEAFNAAYDQERPAVRARLRRLILELESRT